MIPMLIMGLVPFAVIYVVAIIFLIFGKNICLEDMLMNVFIAMMVNLAVTCFGFYDWLWSYVRAFVR